MKKDLSFGDDRSGGEVLIDKNIVLHSAEKCNTETGLKTWQPCHFQPRLNGLTLGDPDEVRNIVIQMRSNHRDHQIHPEAVQGRGIRDTEGKTGEEVSGGDTGGQCETGSEEAGPKTECQLPSRGPAHHPHIRQGRETGPGESERDRQTISTARPEGIQTAWGRI